MIKDPKPGSKEAIEAGCKCPVIDNHHGEGIPMVHPDTQEIQRAYWMDADCIIHGVKGE
jgi:hypothetical protein